VFDRSAAVAAATAATVVAAAGRAGIHTEPRKTLQALVASAVRVALAALVTDAAFRCWDPAATAGRCGVGSDAEPRTTLQTVLASPVREARATFVAVVAFLGRQLRAAASGTNKSQQETQ
jgi:hypothetical protein